MKALPVLAALALPLFLAGGTRTLAQAPACNVLAATVDQAGAGCQRVWFDRNLKLNDLMSVGTHNSYKTQIPDAVLALLRAQNPNAAITLDYRHPPLVDELNAGARQLEIDVYYDPQGGRFLHPVLPTKAGLTQPDAWKAEFARPGFKVMHVPDVDVLSSCWTLVDCLTVIRTWSQAHPAHTPVLLMFNTKNDKSSQAGGTDAIPFDEAAYDALDAEIRSVLTPSMLITPDDVQGRFPTLREAVLADNWPTLGAARGKVLFALDENAAKVALYRGQRKNLEGRVFFINTDEASPAAAYLTLNDPVAQADQIRRDVAAGFIVRTRADADTREARANDTSRRTAALASGAQWVSTDYMFTDPSLHNDYQVRLPQACATVCNPVRAAEKCGRFAVDVTPISHPVIMRVLS